MDNTGSIPSVLCGPEDFRGNPFQYDPAGDFRTLLHLSAGDPAFQTLLSRFSPEEKRGTLFGLAYSMRMVGILLAAAVSGGIIGLTGSIRLVFIAAGILFLLLLVPVFKFLPDIRKGRK